MTYANDPINPTENAMSGPLHGLTKREYFAAMAMQGLLSNETVTSILSGNNGMPISDLISEYSKRYADALIDKLNQEDQK